MKLGVEVGGTFTDLILVNDEGFVVETAKVPSTPANPADGVLEALSSLTHRDLEGIPLVHGSTVTTNAILERKGPTLGLLVTAGFGDILELQRQDREHIYDLHYRKPTPLVPRCRVREIPERIDALGCVVQPLDEPAVRAAVSDLIGSGATSIAVCLLHSYKNPVHERRIKAIIREAHPLVYVSISSEVIPEFREYERASTTVIDAFARPVVERYLGHLERAISELGLAGLWMMQSSGGVLPAGYVRQHPVQTLFSGPAAGVTGALSIACQAAEDRIITMDMGGTSTDVGLITDGQPEVRSEAMINRLPLRVSMLDIVSVGAGGGSIAWLDPGGMLHVGPESAGALPGPACYGRGGTLPTTTDANVVRGLIRPEHFLGGRMRLDRGAASRALGQLARQVGTELTLLAEDIFRVANAAMAGAIRIVSVERGYDPRDYTLVAYGGAGPLHAASVAEELSITRVLVPPYPGLLSAYGLLVGDFQRDFARTDVRGLEDLTLAELAERMMALQHDALAEVSPFLGDPNRVVLNMGIDMRYRGQGFELTVPVRWDELKSGGLAEVEQRFHDLHRTRYGHAAPGDPVDLVTYRLSVIERYPKPATLRVVAEHPRERETMPIILGGRSVACAFVWRPSLQPGDQLSGPVVVEEDMATTFVPPEWRLTVDDATNLVLERGR